MNIFFQLLKTDLKLWYRNIKDKAINVIIWSAAICTATTYVLPAFGTSAQFSVLEAIALIVGAVGFEIYAQIFLLVSDLEGENHLSYYFILPLPNWLVFIKMATMYTINGCFLGLLVLPVLKLILGSSLSLTQIHWPFFLLALIITNIFFSFFAFLLTSVIKNVEQCENVMMRILFPLWFFGGFSFSYKIALSISPVLAYVSLISPYTFATEAVRSSALNSLDYLPIQLSLSVLIILFIVSGYWGIKRLKRKIDFI